MALATDPDIITHGIQLALAPVFLLTAVAAMIGAVAGRLARIIDRARLMEERALAGPDAAALATMARSEVRIPLILPAEKTKEQKRSQKRLERASN